MGRYRIRPLRRSELPVGTVELARHLIGKTLVHTLAAGRRSGRIVETEAYTVGDEASHAFCGQSPRNRSLYLSRGHAYVYRSYALHVLLDVSSEPHGIGAGVLLRALEPLEGIADMGADRGTSVDRELARGPFEQGDARLSEARRLGPV
jgi:DNA-3-methyladenine glycosylase